MKIILTGASGLIGSRFLELMHEKHEIIPLSSKDVAITVEDSVYNFFENNEADFVVHFAAKTDVDGCELDKEEDLRKIENHIGKQTEIEKMDWHNAIDWMGKDSAFAVNFIGTHNIYKTAKEKGIKFIYISTDFVFDGNGEYDEESKPNPLNWYGMTKYYGERVIDTAQNLIVRLSFPYGHNSSVKKDFVWKLIELLKSRDEVSLIEDQTITPTFIDDIVSSIDLLTEKNLAGVFHVSGSSFEDPLRIGQKIKEKLNLATHINATTRDKIYAGKAPRPFKSIMKSDKLTNLGFKTKSFDEGLDSILR